MNLRRFLLLAILPGMSFAADLEINLAIKDHRFTPAEIRVPAGKKVKLIIDNQDASPEEFESHELNREKEQRKHLAGQLAAGFQSAYLDRLRGAASRDASRVLCRHPADDRPWRDMGAARKKC